MGNHPSKISNILSKQIGKCTLTTSAYDTAWVARLKDKNNKPLFPKALAWLENNQLEDGSWGSKTITYYHDRIISTLIAIIALTEQAGNRSQIESGLSFINKNIKNLKKDEHVTIAFELLFPSLILTAQDLGLGVEAEHQETQKYLKLREKKLSAIPLETLYKYKSSLSYSLEFLENYPNINHPNLAIHQEENGSFGNSPSATAFMLKYLPDNIAAKDYLQTIYTEYEGGFPCFYTIDLFERSWALNYLIDFKATDQYASEVEPHLNYLKENWKDKGIASSKYFSAINLDDTAVAFRVLSHLNEQPNPEVFQIFSSKDTFVGHIGETQPGISHLANLAAAVSELPKNNKLRNKVFGLISEQIPQPKSDKWNLSRYYAASRLPLAFFQEYEKIAKNHLQFLLNSQNPDGSWGITGNQQDTDYALLLARKLNSLNNPHLLSAIEKGREYLNNSTPTAVNYWIAKSLYRPKTLESLLTELNLNY